MTFWLHTLGRILNASLVAFCLHTLGRILNAEGDDAPAHEMGLMGASPPPHSSLSFTHTRTRIRTCTHILFCVTRIYLHARSLPPSLPPSLCRPICLPLPVALSIALLALSSSHAHTCTRAHTHAHTYTRTLSLCAGEEVSADSKEAGMKNLPVCCFGADAPKLFRLTAHDYANKRTLDWGVIARTGGDTARLQSNTFDFTCTQFFIGESAKKVASGVHTHTLNATVRWPLTTAS